MEGFPDSSDYFADGVKDLIDVWLSVAIDCIAIFHADVIVFCFRSEIRQALEFFPAVSSFCTPSSERAEPGLEVLSLSKQSCNFLDKIFILCLHLPSSTSCSCCRLCMLLSRSHSAPKHSFAMVSEIIRILLIQCLLLMNFDVLYWGRCWCLLHLFYSLG